MGELSGFICIYSHFLSLSTPRSVEKLFSMRPLPGAKNVGDYEIYLILGPGQAGFLFYPYAFGVFPVLYSNLLGVD